MIVLWAGFLQGLRAVGTIARVVIPLMIVLEIAQSTRWLQKINRVLARPFQSIGLSEEGAFPVVVAMVFGLTFGSGVIVNHVQEGKVTPGEARIIGTFIALSHALIEDTIIFVALGAPFVYLLGPRLLLAFALSYLMKKWVGATAANSEGLSL